MENKKKEYLEEENRDFAHMLYELSIFTEQYDILRLCLTEYRSYLSDEEIQDVYHRSCVLHGEKRVERWIEQYKNQGDN